MLDELNDDALADLKVRVFADGADLDGIASLARSPQIAGFTTNPTLMWKAGLTDYTEFAHRVLEIVPDRPISFEIFADEPAEMRRQAEVIARLGRQRLHQGPGHGHPRQLHRRARPHAVARRRPAQRHGA